VFIMRWFALLLMTLNFRPGKRETAEVEFRGHPDVISSTIAAGISTKIAETLHMYDSPEPVLPHHRLDIGVQCLGGRERCGKTPIDINVGGQVVAVSGLDIQSIAYDVAAERLGQLGYFENGHFSRDELRVFTPDIIPQSDNLNETTQDPDKFADSAVCVGHHIAEREGFYGTFPSLIIAQDLERRLMQNRDEIDGLMSDGKVHVTIEYHENGISVARVNLSVGYIGKDGGGFRDKIFDILADGRWHLDRSKVDINGGGDFNIYFLQADYGMSKAKDDVIITGGLYPIGTDRVWGKCTWKASSTLLPYAFSLSRVVCDVTGAKYASVSCYGEYGKQCQDIQLREIDPDLEPQWEDIQKGLHGLPRGRSEIRELIGLDDGIDSYRAFNDPKGFTHPAKPWKKENPQLIEEFQKGYSG